MINGRLENVKKIVWIYLIGVFALLFHTLLNVKRINYIQGAIIPILIVFAIAFIIIVIVLSLTPEFHVIRNFIMLYGTTIVSFSVIINYMELKDVQWIDAGFYILDIIIAIVLILISIGITGYLHTKHRLEQLEDIDKIIISKHHAFSVVIVISILFLYGMYFLFVLLFFYPPVV